jgi:hypothetical protein
VKTLVLETRTGRDEFHPLVEAAHEAGFRVGWLEWSQAHPLPAVLEGALDRGSPFRTVTVAPSGVVAAKRVEGAPVLKDLLREYFSGCRLVLLRGGDRGRTHLPSIDPDDGGWLLTFPDGISRRGTTEDIVRNLSRPHPWG